jgi:hypothetical protein
MQQPYVNKDSIWKMILIWTAVPLLQYLNKNNIDDKTKEKNTS